MGIPAAAVIRVGAPRTSVALRTSAAAGRILPLIQAVVRRILPLALVAGGRILRPISGALRTLPRIVELVDLTSRLISAAAARLTLLRMAA